MLTSLLIAGWICLFGGLAANDYSEQLTGFLLEHNWHWLANFRLPYFDYGPGQTKAFCFMLIGLVMLTVFEIRKGAGDSKPKENSFDDSIRKGLDRVTGQLIGMWTPLSKRKFLLLPLLGVFGFGGAIIAKTASLKISSGCLWLCFSFSLWALGAGIDYAQDPKSLTRIGQRALSALAFAFAIGATGCALSNRFVAALALGAMALIFFAGLYFRNRSKAITEALLITAVGCVSFVILSQGLRAWEYSFIGDEYGSYGAAMKWAIGPGDLILSAEGVYFEAGQMAAAAQALGMKLFGNDVDGWRLSNTAVLSLGVLPLFRFSQIGAGTLPAFLASAAFGFSHYLGAVGRCGYSGEAILATLIPIFLLTFTTALLEGSILFTVLAVQSIALGFYFHAVGRILPVIAFCFFLSVPGLRNRKRWISVAVLAVIFIVWILPVTLPFSYWQGQLERLVMFNPQTKAMPNMGPIVMARSVQSFFSFALCPVTKLFVTGAHHDYLSAALIMAGIAATIGQAFRSKFLPWALLSSSVIVAVLAGGLSFSAIVPHSRVQVLTPFHAVFAGFGFLQVLTSLPAKLKKSPRPELLCLLAMVIIALLGLRMETVDRAVGTPDSLERRAVRAFQQLRQEQQRKDPALAIVAPDKGQHPSISSVLEVYFGKENSARLVEAPDVTAIDEMCAKKSEALMVLDSPGQPLRARLESCRAGKRVDADQWSVLIKPE